MFLLILFFSLQEWVDSWNILDCGLMQNMEKLGVLLHVLLIKAHNCQKKSISTMTIWKSGQLVKNQNRKMKMESGNIFCHFCSHLEQSHLFLVNVEDYFWDNFDNTFVDNFVNNFVNNFGSMYFWGNSVIIVNNWAILGTVRLFSLGFSCWLKAEGQTPLKGGYPIIFASNVFHNSHLI